MDRIIIHIAMYNYTVNVAKYIASYMYTMYLHSDITGLDLAKYCSMEIPC